MLTVALALALFGATCFVVLAANAPARTLRLAPAPEQVRVTVLQDPAVAPRVPLQAGPRRDLPTADPALWQLMAQTERALGPRRLQLEI